MFNILSVVLVRILDFSFSISFFLLFFLKNSHSSPWFFFSSEMRSEKCAIFVSFFVIPMSGGYFVREALKCLPFGRMWNENSDEIPMKMTGVT